MKLNNHLGDHKDNHNEYSAGSDTPIKSPGFIRALNSQRDDLTNHSPSHHPSPSRPKSSSSRPGTPPPKSFLSEEKRKNRSSVGSRFAAEAKQFFQGNSNYHSSTFNGRRKSTPAIKTSVSSTSVDTPTTSRDSTSFSSLRSRRNSASSEISSLNSNDDFTFAKDVDVPPVPRIPKDFSMTSSQNDLDDQDDQNSTVILSHQPSMSSSSKFNRRKESINSLISFSRFKNDNHHRENYSPTQANCINFTPSSKRHSTVRRMTPSSIPFFRRSSSSSNINGIPNDEPPPPVPSISQSHFANNSTSSNSTSFTNGTNDTTPSTPSNRKSVLGLGFPSLLKTSSSRKSLSSKPVSSENLSNKKNEGSEQSSFRARRNSLSAVIMGRRRGKTVSNVEPVPKIKPEYLHLNDVEKEKGKDNSVTPTVSPQIRSKTVKPIQQQQQQQLRSENLNSRSNTIRNIAHNSTLSSVNNSLETLHPDGKRDLKLITPTRIPRISMSNLQTPQSRSPSSITRKPSTIRKVSDSTIKSSRPSTNGSMTSLNESVTNNNNNHNDSPKEIRKRVIDKSFESKRFSKPSMNEDKVERKNKIHEKSNSVSIVGSKSFGINSTPKSTYSKINSNSNSNNSSNTSTIPTSISSSSISSNKTQQPVRAKSILNSRSSTNFTNSSTFSKNRLINDGKSQDVIAADDEMMAYIKRSQARKLASGASLRELDSMLAFPDPVQPTPRMSPREAIALFGSSLSPYELHEILGYRDIYFVGPSARKRPATKERSSSNHGYDDDRGDYLIIKHDHLNYRYEIIDTLGKGSFGQVLQCLDHKTGNSVAIKIIRNKKRFHHQALVEVKILERLIDWDPENQHNVIMKTEHFYFRGHLCISTELLSINLYELIKANSFAGFSTTLIRRFATQMLQSLVLMKQHNVIHCDLKPENVLLRHPAKSSIKVIDFGSSCFENEKVYTYIQSRFYRSPEVILGMEYTSAIDMWSFGAILVELYTGYPIFPGENEQEQLACLMEVLGIPEKYIIDKSTRRKIFFGEFAFIFKYIQYF